MTQLTRFTQYKTFENIFAASDPVRFIASALNHPDPPSWLSLSQAKWTEDGVVYGSPHGEMDSVEIEVKSDFIIYN